MTNPSSTAMGLLLDVAATLKNDGPIEIGTMFRSPGLRTGNKIVAFLGHGGCLIVKLPRLRGTALVDLGMAGQVTMGARTMREWVAIPAGPDPETTRDTWTVLAKEALHYVRQVPK